MATSTKPTKTWTEHIYPALSCLLCVLMFLGLVCSRAILSISMITLIVISLHPSTLAQNWNKAKRNSFFWLAIALFVTYVISGLWSEDSNNWSAILQIKLPLILLPFALINLPFSIEKYKKLTIYGILVVLTFGMLYSYAFLFVDYARYISADHLPSPVEGDYIRFTVAIVLCINLGVYLLTKSTLNKTEKIFLLSWILFGTFYIHIQAAKSGLVCFYLMLLIHIIFQLVIKKSWKLLILSGLASFFMLFIGLSTIPSIKNQVENLTYERKMWAENDSLNFGTGKSFVPRLISYDIGLKLMYTNPIKGVGAGDLKIEMDKIYNQQYPTIPVGLRLLPHNQFLCTIISNGIPLGLVLIALVIAAWDNHKRNVYSFVNWIIILLILMIEPTLEVQYGVFAFLFFIGIWMAFTNNSISNIPSNSGVSNLNSDRK